MRHFLHILALVAIICWSAGKVEARNMDRSDVVPWGPVGFQKYHNLHTGFRNEDAYRVGFNLAWAEACILYGGWDRLQALHKKIQKILSGKDRTLFEDGGADMAGKTAGDCTTDLYAMVVTDIEKFQDTMGKPLTKGVSVETKFRKVKNLLEKGLITKEEALTAKKEVLRNM